MKKLACLETFGCQMNQLDSELIRSLLEEDGYEMTEDPLSAELVLFNTCSVREHAEARVYGRLGMLKALKEKRPGVVIAVLGCMAQKDRERVFEAAPHVDVVCGTWEFPSLLEFVERARRHGGRQLAVREDAELSGVYSRRRLRPNQFHAYVAVMRGCDNFCSYCIVPYVRGREVSRPTEQVLDEVKRLRDGGVIEFTLLGQNVSSYGKNLEVAQAPSPVRSSAQPGAAGPHFQPAASLAMLLRRVSTVEGVRRIWFITSHPADMKTDVLGAMRDCPNVMPYLHLPAQSGSTRVLERMNRGYTRERFIELVREAHGVVPGIAVATDFIVGFPGETDADFHETLTLVEECRFSSAFIFKYSPRPGTKAAEFADDVPMEVKRRRNAELLALQERISTEENAKFVGRTVEVLVEGPSKTRKDRLMGRARDHRIVIVEGEGICATGGSSASAFVGKIVPVTITASTALALYGK
jgi:tRNA-2-methylthio-N6-dimethylallyladenosine synthase